LRKALNKELQSASGPVTPHTNQKPGMLILTAELLFMLGSFGLLGELKHNASSTQHQGAIKYTPCPRY
jgi:hypothetical protein